MLTLLFVLREHIEHFRKVLLVVRSGTILSSSFFFFFLYFTTKRYKYTKYIYIYIFLPETIFYLL